MTTLSYALRRPRRPDDRAYRPAHLARQRWPGAPAGPGRVPWDGPMNSKDRNTLAWLGIGLGLWLAVSLWVYCYAGGCE